MIIIRQKIYSFHSDSPNIIKLDNGLILKKSEPLKFFRLLGRIIKPIGKTQQGQLIYEIFLNNKNIGMIELNEVNKNEINGVWLSINEEYRGNKYATTVLTNMINYVKSLSYKKFTLEVPGISPDALHIYEKLGFKKLNLISDEDDCWGGLTKMELNLN